VAVGEVGKSRDLQPAAVAVVVVTPQAHRQVLRLAVAVVSQRQQDRALTFRALTGRLVLAARTMRI